MNKTDKSIVRNIWLSESCARSGCRACVESKELDNTIHICKCNCHRKSRFGLQLQPLKKSKGSRIFASLFASIN